MTTPEQTGTRASMRRHLRWGLVLVLILVGGVGGWAATTKISGAVIAPGLLVVESNAKKVQHPTGGIVAEIRARNGDHVKAGEILVRLDDTVTRANLQVVTKNLTELSARKARLEAERDATTKISFPPDLLARTDDPVVAQAIDGERKLFDLRRVARIGEKAQFRERIAQLKQEIIGLEAQAQAKSEELKLIEREMKGTRALWKKGLMRITRITELERQTTRIAGEKARLTADIARSKGQINEIKLKIIQIDRDLVSEVAGELREVDRKLSELVERRVAAEDTLKRIEIRAPQNGTVHQSTAHTVGGVITAADTIMTIVPNRDDLTVEVRVAPQDIDQLRNQQTAKLRFSAFNLRSTPEITGSLTRISADISTDERSQRSYYTVRIALAAEEVARLGDVTLVPGMPVEAFIQTGERNVLSYLVKPLSDQIERAWREQ